MSHVIAKLVLVYFCLQYWYHATLNMKNSIKSANLMTKLKTEFAYYNILCSLKDS